MKKLSQLNEAILDSSNFNYIEKFLSIRDLGEFETAAKRIIRSLKKEEGMIERDDVKDFFETVIEELLNKAKF